MRACDFERALLLPVPLAPPLRPIAARSLVTALEAECASVVLFFIEVRFADVNHIVIQASPMQADVSGQNFAGTLACARYSFSLFILAK